MTPRAKVNNIVFCSMFLKIGHKKIVHSICDSYRKFGAAAPRQSGIISRPKSAGV